MHRNKTNLVDTIEEKPIRTSKSFEPLKNADELRSLYLEFEGKCEELYRQHLIDAAKEKELELKQFFEWAETTYLESTAQIKDNKPAIHPSHKPNVKKPGDLEGYIELKIEKMEGLINALDVGSPKYQQYVELIALYATAKDDNAIRSIDKRIQALGMRPHVAATICPSPVPPNEIELKYASYNGYTIELLEDGYWHWFRRVK